MFLVSSCSCSIHWSQVLCEEWRCSWSSANRRCFNYLWVINTFIANERVAYIRGLRIVTMSSKVTHVVIYAKHWGKPNFTVMYIFIFQIWIWSWKNWKNKQTVKFSWKIWTSYASSILYSLDECLNGTLLVFHCTTKIVNKSLLWNLTCIIYNPI